MKPSAFVFVRRAVNACLPEVRTLNEMPRLGPHKTMVTLAGYCVPWRGTVYTLVPAIVPILFFPPSEQID
jgi:hypothetical protein